MATFKKVNYPSKKIYTMKGAGEILSDDADVTTRGFHCSTPSLPSSLSASNTWLTGRTASSVHANTATCVFAASYNNNDRKNCLKYVANYTCSWLSYHTGTSREIISASEW